MNRPQPKAYLYGLKTKDYPVFYIGSTVKDIQVRLKQHLDQVRYNNHKNKYLLNKINKLGIENIEAVLLKTVAERNRFKAEYKLIAQYTAKGVHLTNLQLEPSVRRPYQAKGGIPWPEPEVFINDVRQWISWPKDGYVKNPVTEYINEYLGRGLYLFFFGDDDLQSFMRNYLTPKVANDLRKEIKSSIRYVDIKQSNTDLRTQTGSQING